MPHLAPQQLVLLSHVVAVQAVAVVVAADMFGILPLVGKLGDPEVKLPALVRACRHGARELIIGAGGSESRFLGGRLSECHVMFGSASRPQK